MISLTDNYNEYLYSMYKLKRIDPNSEFEIRFGLPLKKFNGKKNIITEYKFTNLINSLKSNFEFISKSNTLDMFIYENNNVNSQLNLRFSMNNSEIISLYCKNLIQSENLLDNPNIEILYKNNYIINNDHKYIIDNLNAKNLNKLDKSYNLDNQDYNIRFSLKSEVLFNQTNQAFITSNFNLKKLVEIEFLKYKSLLSNNNNNINNIYKTYRLKNRYSFKLGNHRLDLTVVRSSKKVLNNHGYYENMPIKDFINSNLINEKKTYEIELELFNYDNSSHKSIELWEKTELINLQKHIEYIIVNLNNFPKIIKNSENLDVLYIYKLFIQNNIKNILDKKINDINSLIELDELKNNLLNAEQDKKIIIKSEMDKINSLINDKLFTDNIIKNKLNKSQLLAKYNKYKLKPFIKNYFTSPKLISLEMKHLVPIVNDTDNKLSIINNNYCVTDKADGHGMLLYILGLNHLSELDSSKFTKYNGNIYLIDSNLKFYNTGLKLDLSKQNQTNYLNTLINGEFIDSDIHKNKIFKFIAYDLYILNNIDCKKLNLISNDDTIKTRYKLLNDYIDKIELIKNSDLSLDLSIKKYGIGIKKTKNIFLKCNNIWKDFLNDNSDYKYDGLIFTPIDLPVSYSHNNLDYDLNISQTWNLNMKWKPFYENTIDFLIKLRYNNLVTYNNNTIKEPLINLLSVDNAQSYRKYLTYDLYVGKNTNSNNPCVYNTKNVNKYLPTKFVPSNPYHPNAHICKQFIKKNNKVYCKHWDKNTNKWIVSQDVIKDNTIVEFAYNSNSDNNEFSWIPIRNRIDKTIDYESGLIEKNKLFNILNKFINLAKNKINVLTNEQEKLILKIKPVINFIPNLDNKYYNSHELYNFIKSNYNLIEDFYPNYNHINFKCNYGNNYRTANSNWSSIHNPITQSMITTGDNIPNNLSNQIYYMQENNRKKSLFIHMRNFHNKIIKDSILIKNTKKLLNYNNIHDIKLLDLACGKGGDINKWKKNIINEIIGIDIIHNNIFDTVDGACVRYNNMVEDYKGIDWVPNINFLVGDISLDISNGNAFKNNSFSYNLWQKIWIDNNLKNNNFNVISIMFAIHYIFNDETKINKLIENIDNNLKPGGYFVGTCFDGQQLFKLLESKKKGESIEGYKNNTKIYKITKLYDNKEFKNDNTSINYPIDVFVKSIHSENSNTEYLVNFEFLVKLLEQKNIYLLDDQQTKLLDFTNKSTGLFSEVFTNLDEIIKNPSLNSNDKTIYNNIIDKMSETEKQFSFINRYFIFRKLSNEDILFNKIYKFILNQLSTNKIYTKLIKKNNWAELKLIVRQNFIFNDDIWLKIINKIHINYIINGKLSSQKKKKLKVISESKLSVLKLPRIKYSDLEMFEKIFKMMIIQNKKYNFIDNLTNIFKTNKKLYLQIKQLLHIFSSRENGIYKNTYLYAKQEPDKEQLILITYKNINYDKFIKQYETINEFVILFKTKL